MGRPVGSLNKPKRALLVLLQEKYPDYHPVIEMAAVANNDVDCPLCEGEGCDECVNGKSKISLDMKFNANKEVAQYVTPKLKATEHSGRIDSEVTRKHRVSFTRG